MTTGKGERSFVTGRDSKQHQNVGPVSRSGLPPGRYEAVMIDFYGTIAAGDREIVETSCASIAEAFHLPLSAPALAERWGRRFFHAIEQANRNGFRTLQTCEIESLEETLRELGVETDGAPLVAELEAYWRDPPFYGDALEFLRNCPLPVCCVSNADAEPLAQAVDKLGASFHAVVSSEEARAYKPAPAIFETALRRLGVSPDR
ncbi:MAG: hypothetical protein D6788_11310, partial [Planctomycetota bacterium]